MFIVVDYTEVDTGAIPPPRPKQKVWNDIVDADISMYDEIMVSSTSTPTFSVDISFDTHETNLETFSGWWKFVTARNLLTDKKLPAFLRFCDSLGNTLADGRIMEYTEDRENFKVSIKVESILKLELEKEAKIHEKAFSRNIIGNMPVEGFRAYWLDWLEWIRSLIFPSYSFELRSDSFFLNYSQFMRNKFSSLAGHQGYHLRTYHEYSSDKKTLLKQLAMIMNAKIIYAPATKSFIFVPFEAYSDDPINATGFVSSVDFDSREQAISEINLMARYTTHIRAYTIGGTQVGTYRSSLRDISYSALREIVRFKKYDIWGYTGEINNIGEMITPSKIVHTGETVSLNGVNYYIQDISYEFERLNDLKSFKAVGVRFVK